MSAYRFLVANGVVLSPSDAPPVSTFLESHHGAYTTTRTSDNGSLVLFWERHLRRLANSTQILANSTPKLVFQSQEKQALPWDSAISPLVNESVRKVLPMALEERKSGEELAITALVSANLEKLSGNEDRISRAFFDVYIHMGVYVPPLFGTKENGAHLAVVGQGRDVANAKYSDWVRLRKPLEKLRPPSASELMLSNDGDHILEGCITNFFVVCRMARETFGKIKGLLKLLSSGCRMMGIIYMKDETDDCHYDALAKNLHGYSSAYAIEIQTAPITDGVLPGVIRQVIIDICSSCGIPFREVAPSWSKCDTWEEAFITNSLRLLQHVETIQVPSLWGSLKSKTWKEVTWEEKLFKEGPGMITTLIQKEMLKRASVEGYPVTLFDGFCKS